MPYTRQQCDQLGGDFFPRTGDCLYDRRSYGSSKLSDQPYFLMLGVAGAAAVGWYFFVGRR